jgi:hypothetical protein
VEVWAVAAEEDVVKLFTNLTHTPLMKMPNSLPLLLASLSLVGSSMTLAGTNPSSDPNAVAAAEFDDPTGWEFTFVSPGWIAGAEGTIGVNGIDSAIDVTFADIINNLGVLGAAGIEGHHGKFGFILEGTLYTKTAVGGSTPGPLLSTVGIGIEQLVAEGTLTYRIFESDRGWLELLAGARYTYMSTTLDLTTDAAGVAAVSQNLSAEIFDRAEAAARQEVARRLAALTAGLAAPADDIPGARVGPLGDRVLNRTGGFLESIRGQLGRGLGSDETGLGDRFPENGPVRSAIRDYVEAKVQAELEAARADASAAVGAARANARAAAERRLARAETRLANSIERRLNDLIPDSELQASKAWVDPFIGFQGRWDLNDQFYLVGRGDIGGFGVSSDLTWNAYAAFGTEVNERTSVELGYRYYQVDYERGGFNYNVATKGPFIGVKVDF